MPPLTSRSAPAQPRIRVNRQIRVSPLRVIGAEGEQLGILELSEALARAEAAELDLVEVAPAARPPVVRIMDYGKYKFEQSKQARLARKKQHVVEVKEAKFRPQIGDHDFDVKVRHLREWLAEGLKCRVLVQFRGRQITHPELGFAVAERVIAGIGDLGKVETAPKLEGKLIGFNIAPKR